jgi:iron complex transport system ATP-binding protein
MTNLLALEGVRVALGSREVLKGIDLEVAPGQIVALLGPNGSGKSTLLAAAAGIGRRDAGRVLVQGEDLNSLTRKEAAGRIAVVPQQTGFMTPFTVMETVLMGRFPSTGRFSRLTAEDRRVAAQSLEAVDLSSFGERLVTDLSGGEAQRVAIARALAQDTKVLLLDEPVSALDPRHAIAVFRLLGGLRKEGRGILVALHDINYALRFADRVLFLKDGFLLEPPSPRAVDDVILAEVFETPWSLEELSGGFRAAFPVV